MASPLFCEELFAIIKSSAAKERKENQMGLLTFKGGIHPKDGKALVRLSTFVKQLHDAGSRLINE